ncbi:MAG: 50S ribosomal protein L21 [bacterium]|nr:50S ribosomal protein L21 [bacterium]
MFAVVKTGGKQYIVKEGDVLNVEKLEVEQGKTITLDTLLIAEEDASKMDVGTPSLGEKVSAEIIEQGRAKKVEVIKYKPKVRYRRRVGHRQPFTKIKITKIA